MTLNKYISFGAVAMITVAGLSSCDSKNDPAYIPAGSVSDSQRVFFLKNAYTQIVSAEENSFEFYVYRPDLNKLDENGDVTAQMPAQSVKINASCAEDGVLGSMISVPTDVNFEAGSPNAMIKVTYDPAKMTGNHYYPIVLTVDPEYANEYSITSTTLSINKEEYTDWAPFIVGEETEIRNGEGSFTFTQYYSGTEDPVRVLARSVPTNPNDIQFQFQWLIDYDDPNSWETFMTAYTKDGGKIVHVDPQAFAYNANYDEDVIVADTYTYTGNDQYKGLTNFDPETGLFTLNLYYYISLGSFGNGNEFLQLRGYKDTNVYELTVQPQGQMEVGGKDYEMVNFSFTEAVTYVDYTVVDGELEEEEVNAVIEKMTDPDQDTYTISRIEKSQNVAMTFPSSGEYTVVAVGYNEAIDGTVEAKCSAYASFSYTTFDPYANWSPVTNNALYVDTFLPTLAAMMGGELPETDMTVRVDKSDEYKGLYRITDPFAESEYVEALGLGRANFGCIEFAILGDGRVYFPKNSVGLLDGSDEIYLASASYYFMTEQGMEPDDLPDYFFGTLNEEGTQITMEPTGGNPSDFILWFGGEGPYLCDMYFYLDLAGGAGAPAHAPALKTGKVEKALAKMKLAGMPKVKAAAFPAFYKAVPQGAASVKLDRNVSKQLKSRR
ncbi:MAG: hypothetical protein K2L22_05830 [Muribaculaceae bacterium]|nr:hypothetical protein [Muribaculaceae bacterium]